MIIYDLKIDNENNLIIKNGDFVIDNSVNQHALNLLELNRGDLRFAPSIGCDLIYELNSKMNKGFRDRIYNNVKQCLKVDGYDTFNIKFDINTDTNTVKLLTKAKRIRL